MLKKLFWRFLAFAFPWLVLLINDNPGGAIVALFMQATLFGWPPATVWAWRTIRENQLSLKKSSKS
ncbi:hypothetical protein ACNVED_00940 [Legionella sp. D16C41]|uniref:hypothetical protein n=1 Tax=Legionella sp. D16C41 TaxID=3402688 RepID=UPI003AF4C910